MQWYHLQNMLVGNVTRMYQITIRYFSKFVFMPEKLNVDTVGFKFMECSECSNSWNARDYLGMLRNALKEY